MPTRQRTFSSLLLAFVLLVGGIITFVAGLGYMESEDVSVYIASIDVVAGLALILGMIFCLVGRRPMWRWTLATIVVEAVAGVAMLFVTLAGGIVLIVISALLIWWMFTSAITSWYQV